jgi:hypothetical protein
MDERSSKKKIGYTKDRLGPTQAVSGEEFIAVEKSFMRKLDVRLMAMVRLIFVVNYLNCVRSFSGSPRLKLTE